MSVSLYMIWTQKCHHMTHNYFSTHSLSTFTTEWHDFFNTMYTKVIVLYTNHNFTAVPRWWWWWCGNRSETIVERRVQWLLWTEDIKIHSTLWQVCHTAQGLCRRSLQVIQWHTIYTKYSLHSDCPSYQTEAVECEGPRSHICL